MVDGTGLENQQVNASQVRILSPPPGIKRSPFRDLFLCLVGQDENRRFDRTTK